MAVWNALVFGIGLGSGEVEGGGGRMTDCWRRRTELGVGTVGLFVVCFAESCPGQRGLRRGLVGLLRSWGCS